MRPPVIILDEPTAGQDFRHYTAIMDFLKSLNEEEYVVNFIYKGYSADTGLCESKIEVYAGSPKESTAYSDIEPIYSLEVNRHLPERME